MVWPAPRGWVVKGQLEGTCPFSSTLEPGLKPPTPVRTSSHWGTEPGQVPSLAWHRQQGANLIFHMIPHFYLLYVYLEKQTTNDLRMCVSFCSKRHGWFVCSWSPGPHMAPGTGQDLNQIYPPH